MSSNKTPGNGQTPFVETSGQENGRKKAEGKGDERKEVGMGWSGVVEGQAKKEKAYQHHVINVIQTPGQLQWLPLFFHSQFLEKSPLFLKKNK